jgi:hypothetical protein
MTKRAETAIPTGVIPAELLHCPDCRGRTRRFSPKRIRNEAVAAFLFARGRIVSADGGDTLDAPGALDAVWCPGCKVAEVIDADEWDEAMADGRGIMGWLWPTGEWNMHLPADD